MFNYQEFVQNVKSDGLSKSNRFYIEIASPSLTGESGIIFGSAGQNLRNLHMFCSSVSIPGVNIASTSIRTTGEMLEAPYDRNFGDSTLTFYVDRQMYVRKFFDDWVNTIQNQSTKIFNYYDDFIADTIKVFVLDKKDHENYAITMHECYPKTVGSLSLAHNSNDVMTLDVTFTYKYYTTSIIVHQETEGVPTTSTIDSLKDSNSLISSYTNDFIGFQQSIIPGGQGVFNDVYQNVASQTNNYVADVTTNEVVPTFSSMVKNLPTIF